MINFKIKLKHILKILSLQYNDKTVYVKSIYDFHNYITPEEVEEKRKYVISLNFPK